MSEENAVTSSVSAPDTSGPDAGRDSGGTPTVQQQARGAVADIGMSAVSGAAQGAMVGGVHGAAVGAVKGIAVGAVRNPVIQRVIIGAVAALLIVALAVGAALINGAVTAVAAITGTEDQNAQHAIESAGLPSEVVAGGTRAAQATGLPEELTTAVLQKNDKFDFDQLARSVQEADPERDDRNLLAGAVADSGRVGRYIPQEGAGAEAADRVRKVYTSALAASGFSESDATKIYDIALTWALGETTPPEEQECIPTAPGAGGPGMELGGAEWTGSQVSNMKVIIGLAKTMFPESAEQAAIVGLITARVESSYQNYANDGEIGPEDFNMGSATAADYAKLAHSLKLPHDAVGTDHSSLGIMQQQAVAGWGDFGASTWSTDPEGVIARLMTPAHAAAKFFVRLDGVDGWEALDPGVAAQTVQISAFPDAYERHIELAEAIWDALGATSPGLNVPASSGWVPDTESPEGGETPAGPSPCAGSSIPLTGEYGWPVGEKPDGTMAGYVSSEYGWRIHPSGAVQFHEGVDLVADAGPGSPIYAAGDGVVTQSKLWPNPACQQYVEILHEDGTSTGYLHLSSRSVSVGDNVTAGSQVGTEGGLAPGGCTFGYHVHMYAYDAAHATYDFLVWAEQHNLISEPKDTP